MLEAGCGRTTRLGGYRRRIARLVGVDLDTEAGRANEALDEFVVADLCRPLPFADGSFDLVYANFVVEHLVAPAEAFREWRRVLRPDGSLILLTSNVANPAVWLAVRAPRRLRIAAKRRGAGAAEHDVIAPVHRANTPSRLEAQLCDGGVRPRARRVRRDAAPLRRAVAAPAAPRRSGREQRCRRRGGRRSSPATAPAETCLSALLPRSLSMSAARRAGRPMPFSTRSACAISLKAALMPSQRSGSRSQLGDLWPTQGSVVRSDSRPVIRSASVLPARFAVATPSPA